MTWIKGLTLKLYLDNLIESVQRKSLHIIFPAVDYLSIYLNHKVVIS